MDDIIDQVLRSSDHAVADAMRQRVVAYVRLLASTGQSKRQLMRYGTAYLRELLEPDSRYSGL